MEEIEPSRSLVDLHRRTGTWPFPSMESRAMDALAAHPLVVGLAGVAAAWSSRENEFVWDDRAAVLANRDVDARASHWSELFAHDFWGSPIESKTSHKSYRPLTVLSFRWNHSWHGFDPRAYHLTNVVLHAICSVLVWRTATVVLRDASASGQTKRLPKWGPLLAGLLFAVHPIHCDSVASIVGRADLLCVAFGLAGFLLYDVAKSQSSWGCFFAALVFGVLACLCKELGFTVYGLYAVTDVLRAIRAGGVSLTLSDVLVRRLGLLLTAVVVLSLARVWINGQHTKAVFNRLANSINHEESQFVRMMSYAHVHAWYLWKLVWPSWFSYDYGFKTIPVITQVLDPRNGLTALAYCSVFVGTYMACRDVKQSPLLMCIAFGVIPFVPASNLFFPVGTIVAERLLYFPSVGFCLIVGYLAEQFLAALTRYEDYAMRLRTYPGGTRCAQVLIATSARVASKGLVGCILVAALLKSAARNTDWKTEETLFTSAVEVVPENVKVLTNAAKVLLNRDSDRALDLSRVSVALAPEHIEGQTNLGLGYTHTPSKLLAIRHMIKSFSFSSTEVSGAGYAGVHSFNYWESQHVGGVSTEQIVGSPTVRLAVRFLNMAIRRGSRTPLHFYQRGIISGRLDDASTSLRFMERARRANELVAHIDTEMMLNPGPLHNTIALLRRQIGQDDDALSELIAGIGLYPTETTLYFNAATMYMHRGMLDVASRHLERCLEVCEGSEMMAAGARLLEKLGQPRAAQAFFDRAAVLSANE